MMGRLFHRIRTLGRRYRVARRQGSSILLDIAAILLALLLSLIATVVLIASYGASPVETLQALFRGAFGTRNAVLETLVQATPLMFTGLAVVVAFRGRMFNIGGEGQFWAGAVAATWTSMHVGSLPGLIAVPLIIVGAAAGGGLWGLIPGYLKAKFQINEIIVTVMLNYAIMFFVSYLVSGPWREPNQYYLQTVRFDASTDLPRFFGSRIHLGLFIAVFLALLVYVLLWKTPFGFDIRAIGDNPTSSRYRGVKVDTMLVLIMVLSGALAGIAGAGELNGLHHRLKLDISNRFGFTGLLVAQLGKLHPLGVILASIFFGALVNGSTGMQIYTGVPVSLVYTVQGMVLVFLLASEGLTRYRIVRVDHD
jgi:ABC-type uncharacterized transport system permease subunit